MDMVEYRERALAIHSNWIEHPLTIEEKIKAQKCLIWIFKRYGLIV